MNIDLLTKKMIAGFGHHLQKANRNEFERDFPNYFSHLSSLFPTQDAKLDSIIRRFAGIVQIYFSKKAKLGRGDLKKMDKGLKLLLKVVPNVLAADLKFILRSNGDLSRLRTSIPNDLAEIAQILKDTKHERTYQLSYDFKKKATIELVDLMKELLKQKRVEISSREIAGSLADNFFESKKSDGRTTAIKLAALFLLSIGIRGMTTDRLGDLLRGKPISK